MKTITTKIDDLFKEAEALSRVPPEGVKTSPELEESVAEKVEAPPDETEIPEDLGEL